MPPTPAGQPLPAGTEWLPPTAPATWQPWQRDPEAPHFPFHQYIQAKHAADRAVGPDPDMEMQRQIASAAAIMVGQEVHELNAALRHRMYAEFTPCKRQEPGVKPRIRVWVMAPTGRRIPVTILVDDGALHCFVNSSVAREWGLEQSGEPGPAGVLLAAGDVVHAVDTQV